MKICTARAPPKPESETHPVGHAAKERTTPTCRQALPCPIPAGLEVTHPCRSRPGVVVGFALPRSAWGGGFALGLLIRWVWVFAVVGWVFVVVGLGLCRGGGLVDSVVGWVFAVVGWVFVVVGLGLCRGGGLVDSVVGLGLCGGGLGLCGGGLGLCGGGFGSLPRPGVVESVAWGGCWVTGSGARPEGGGAVPFGG
uniref:Uncharacterized protein n=1 Tax=Fagus sylvatica TaxID=28930 RepID=A0A2N9IRY5_FAGSY